MSKLDDAAAKMIANLEAKTGKSLSEWITIAQQSGETKHRAIINHLKSEHGLTHGYANLIAARTRKAAQPATELSLVDQQYAGAKAALRPIYNTILDQVNQFGGDVELAPKKAYVSLRRKKQFAIIQPSTRTRVDVGINLKGDEPTDRLEKSGSFNSMVSHRVRLTDAAHVDDQLISWLREAYERAG